MWIGKALLFLSYNYLKNGGCMESKTHKGGISLTGVMLASLMGVSFAFNNLHRADEILKFVAISVNVVFAITAGFIYVFYRKKDKWKGANERLKFSRAMLILMFPLALFCNYILFNI